MKHITKEQRYEIKAFLKCKMKQSFIAKELGVSESTISRELKRNSSKRGVYIPDKANEKANERKERFNQERKFDINTERIVVKHLIEEQLSPKQIVGICKKKNIPMVSHERIYAFIRHDKASGGELYKHTRHRLKHRKRPVGGKKVVIKNKVSIDERSDVINNKERFGDWEIDLIVGVENKGAIVTIVERTTAFFMMKKLKKGKNAKSLADEVTQMLMPYKNCVHSITSDNGTEFAEHQEISKQLDSQFFFCHPYASWERGLSEYTNKLVRQYILKKSSFNQYNEQYIIKIQHKINKRPRETLDFNNPKELFYKFVK